MAMVAGSDSRQEPSPRFCFWSTILPVVQQENARPGMAEASSFFELSRQRSEYSMTVAASRFNRIHSSGHTWRQ